MDKSKWEYKKLGEVALYPRKRFEKEFLNVGNYVGVENLIKDKTGRIDAEDIPANSSSTIEYYKNDILIGNIRPYLRKIWIADNNGGASGDVLVIRINVDYQKKIFPNYLYRVLSNDSFFDYDMAHSKGAKMPRGDKDAVLKYIIPVPSYADQQRIVAELDCLNKMIAVKQEQLKEFDKLAQSIFYDMFGDPINNEKQFPKLTIDDVIKFEGGSQPARSYFEYEPTPDNIRLIQIRDYKTDAYITYIPKKMARRFCEEDDIMIGRYGPPIFQILRGLKGAYNVALMKAVPKKGNKEFIRAFLKQECLLHYLENFSRRVAGQDGIQMDELKAYPFPYPPLSLQQQFADKISAIEAQKELVKQSIAETQHLLDYTMDKYFG